jgi:Fic family protein
MEKIPHSANLVGELVDVTLRLRDESNTGTVDLLAKAFIPHHLPPAEELIAWNRTRAALQAEAAEWLGRTSVKINEIHNGDVRWLVRSFVRKEAVYSSRIEGTKTTLVDYLAYETDDSLPDRDALEVMCNVEALEGAIGDISTGVRVSTSWLARTHETLMRFDAKRARAGRFRDIQNYIHRGGAATLAESIKFVPPPPLEVEPLVRALCDYLDSEAAKGYHPLVNAALTHALFEIIHPYADGNGRVGRILIPAVLMQSGCLPIPALPISLFLKQRRDEYYSLLLKITSENNWEAWVDFFLNAVIAAGKESARIIDNYKELLAKDGALFKNTTNADYKVWRAFLESPVLSVENIVAKTGISVPQAYLVTKKLSEKGLIRELPKKGKTSRIYAYINMFKALREKAVFHGTPIVYDQVDGDVTKLAQATGDEADE